MHELGAGASFRCNEQVQLALPFKMHDEGADARNRLEEQVQGARARSRCRVQVKEQVEGAVTDQLQVELLEPGEDGGPPVSQAPAQGHVVGGRPGGR